jgi:hypothetical protein
MTRGRKILLGVGVLVILLGGILFLVPAVTGRPLLGWNECQPLRSPVDVSLVTSVLYPGQYRGGHYKAHGGFRLDGSSNTVTVSAPLDATLVKAAQYLEMGEVQYLLDFKTDCGLEYRFDHLLTLAPKLQAVADKLPPPQEGNSRTHNVDSAITVTAGEPIASAVGFTKGEHGPNVSFDFGLYDRRTENEASHNPAWAELHSKEKYHTWHGVCWLDVLPPTEATRLKSLPGGDSTSGKQSDYCR